jgi:hypothetical protein
VTDLSTRELAHHIVRNVDPWCDADAIRVAQAYLDLVDNTLALLDQHTSDEVNLETRLRIIESLVA